MKKLSALLLLSLTASLASAQSAKPPIVIAITLDGFPARALKDPKLPMPTLRALIAKGAVSEGMIPINPSVTWANHTTLISGVNAAQHHILANGQIVLPADGTAPKVMPWVEKDKWVNTRTLYEAAADKGMTVGAVDWVAIFGGRGVTWQFGENPNLHDHDEIPKELVAQGTLSQDLLDHFSGGNPAWHDEVWANAAVEMIEKHQPRLLLVHLLETDSIQHEYGPLTSAAYAAYAYADTRLQKIVEAVQRAGIADRTTFFILSDHGFTLYTHTISPNAALIEQGYLQKQGNAATGDVWARAMDGLALLYVRDKSKRAELLPKLKSYFATVPGITHVYTSQEGHDELGLPVDTESDQAPQLYLTAAADYALVDDLAGPINKTIPVAKGQHGYVNSMPDMQALFVASGAAIQPGVHLGVFPNLRVAPTMAKILGLSLPDAKEPALDEILRH